MAHGVSKLAWKTIGLVSGVLAASVTRKVLDKTWQRARGGEPPRNPASATTSWGEAVAWAAASGVAVAVARLLTARATAAGWRKATGALPPGLEEVGA